VTTVLETRVLLLVYLIFSTDKVSDLQSHVNNKITKQRKLFSVQYFNWIFWVGILNTEMKYVLVVSRNSMRKFSFHKKNVYEPHSSTFTCIFCFLWHFHEPYSKNG
jgi:hypothetical protein